MVTVILAVALTLAGLAVTIQPIGFVNDALSAMGLDLTREQGWWALLLSPVLLIAGSFLPNL